MKYTKEFKIKHLSQIIEFGKDYIKGREEAKKKGLKVVTKESLEDQSKESLYSFRFEK